MVQREMKRNKKLKKEEMLRLERKRKHLISEQSMSNIIINQDRKSRANSAKKLSLEEIIQEKPNNKRQNKTRTNNTVTKKARSQKMDLSSVINKPPLGTKGEKRITVDDPPVPSSNCGKQQLKGGDGGAKKKTKALRNSIGDSGMPEKRYSPLPLEPPQQISEPGEFTLDNDMHFYTVCKMLFMRKNERQTVRKGGGVI